MAAFFMRINPLTYAVDALRSALFPTQTTDFSRATNLWVTVLFCIVTFAASAMIVNRRNNQPAA